MQITDVRIRKVNDNSKMKALASVTIDHRFVVHEVRVIEGQNGYFIAMPSRKMSDGQFRDIAHPLDGETRQAMQEAVLKSYGEALERLREQEEARQAAGSVQTA